MGRLPFFPSPDSCQMLKAGHAVPCSHALIQKHTAPREPAGPCTASAPWHPSLWWMHLCWLQNKFSYGVVAPITQHLIKLLESLCSHKTKNINGWDKPPPPQMPPNWHWHKKTWADMSWGNGQSKAERNLWFAVINWSKSVLQSGMHALGPRIPLDHTFKSRCSSSPVSSILTHHDSEFSKICDYMPCLALWKGLNLFPLQSLHEESWSCMKHRAPQRPSETLMFEAYRTQDFIQTESIDEGKHQLWL